MNAISDPLAALATLEHFLACFDLEAVAHGRSELTTDERALLARMAGGELAGEARQEAVRLLSENTVAVEFLADLLKGGKGSTAERGDS